MRIAITAALTVTALAATTGPALATAEVSGKDRAAIIKLLNTAERSTDPNKSCAVFTTAAIKALYGSKQYCLNAHATYDPASDLPKSISVSSISVSGSTAKVKVTERGGSSATGRWQLTRSGGSWKVSGIGADFLRSGLSHDMGPRYASAGATDPLDSKPYRLCGLAGLLHRSDKAFVAFQKEIASAHNKVFGTVMNSCTSTAPGGKSPWRALFEADIKARFSSDGQPGAAAAADCMIGHLRTLISEPALINAQMDGAGTAGYDKTVGTAWSNAAAACNKQMKVGSIRAPHAGTRPPIH